MINFGNIFVSGQSTNGFCSSDEQDIANGLSGLLNDLHKSYSDVSFASTKSIQSEFQNLKAQIARLEDGVERHHIYMNDSIQELKRQLQMETNERKSEFQAQCQKLPW